MLELLSFVAVGFLAQLVDGALGMAYGVTATSVLLQLGTPPAIASASIHAAETFTTGASALSHWRLGNVERRLVARLAVPGVLGGIAGAYLLSSFPGQVLRPVVSLTCSPWASSSSSAPIAGPRPRSISRRIR